MSADGVGDMRTAVAALYHGDEQVDGGGVHADFTESEAEVDEPLFRQHVRSKLRELSIAPDRRWITFPSLGSSKYSIWLRLFALATIGLPLLVVMLVMRLCIVFAILGPVVMPVAAAAAVSVPFQAFYRDVTHFAMTDDGVQTSWDIWATTISMTASIVIYIIRLLFEIWNGLCPLIALLVDVLMAILKMFVMIFYAAPVLQYFALWVVRLVIIMAEPFLDVLISILESLSFLFVGIIETIGLDGTAEGLGDILQEAGISVGDDLSGATVGAAAMASSLDMSLPEYDTYCMQHPEDPACSAHKKSAEAATANSQRRLQSLELPDTSGANDFVDDSIEPVGDMMLRIVVIVLTALLRITQAFVTALAPFMLGFFVHCWPLIPPIVEAVLYVAGGVASVLTSSATRRILDFIVQALPVLLEVVGIIVCNLIVYLLPAFCYLLHAICTTLGFVLEYMVAPLVCSGGALLAGCLESFIYDGGTSGCFSCGSYNTACGCEKNVFPQSGCDSDSCTDPEGVIVVPPGETYANKRGGHYADFSNGPGSHLDSVSSTTASVDGTGDVATLKQQTFEPDALDVGKAGLADYSDGSNTFHQPSASELQMMRRRAGNTVSGNDPELDVDSVTASSQPSVLSTGLHVSASAGFYGSIHAVTASGGEVVVMRGTMPYSRGSDTLGCVFGVNESMPADCGVQLVQDVMLAYTAHGPAQVLTPGGGTSWQSAMVMGKYSGGLAPTLSSWVCDRAGALPASSWGSTLSGSYTGCPWIRVRLPRPSRISAVHVTWLSTATNARSAKDYQITYFSRHDENGPSWGPFVSTDNGCTPNTRRLDVHEFGGADAERPVTSLLFEFTRLCPPVYTTHESLLEISNIAVHGEVLATPAPTPSGSSVGVAGAASMFGIKAKVRQLRGSEHVKLWEPCGQADMRILSDQSDRLSTVAYCEAHTCPSATLGLKVSMHQFQTETSGVVINAINTPVDIVTIDLADTAKVHPSKVWLCHGSELPETPPTSLISQTPSGHTLTCVAASEKFSTITTDLQQISISEIHSNIQREINDEGLGDIELPFFNESYLTATGGEPSRGASLTFETLGLNLPPAGLHEFAVWFLPGSFEGLRETSWSTVLLETQMDARVWVDMLWRSSVESYLLPSGVTSTHVDPTYCADVFGDTATISDTWGAYTNPFQAEHGTAKWVGLKEVHVWGRYNQLETRRSDNGTNGSAKRALLKHNALQVTGEQRKQPNASALDSLPRQASERNFSAATRDFIRLDMAHRVHSHNHQGGGHHGDAIAFSTNPRRNDLLDALDRHGRHVTRDHSDETATIIGSESPETAHHHPFAPRLHLMPDPVNEPRLNCVPLLPPVKTPSTKSSANFPLTDTVDVNCHIPLTPAIGHTHTPTPTASPTASPVKNVHATHYWSNLDDFPFGNLEPGSTIERHASDSVFDQMGEMFGIPSSLSFLHWKTQLGRHIANHVESQIHKQVEGTSATKVHNAPSSALQATSSRRLLFLDAIGDALGGAFGGIYDKVKEVVLDMFDCRSGEDFGECLLRKILDPVYQFVKTILRMLIQLVDLIMSALANVMGLGNTIKLIACMGCKLTTIATGLLADFTGMVGDLSVCMWIVDQGSDQCDRWDIPTSSYGLDVFAVIPTTLKLAFGLLQILPAMAEVLLQLSVILFSAAMELLPQLLGDAFHLLLWFATISDHIEMFIMIMEAFEPAIKEGFMRGEMVDSVSADSLRRDDVVYEREAMFSERCYSHTTNQTSGSSIGGLDTATQAAAAHTGKCTPGYLAEGKTFNTMATESNNRLSSGTTIAQGDSLTFDLGDCGCHIQPPPCEAGAGTGGCNVVTGRAQEMLATNKAESQRQQESFHTRNASDMEDWPFCPGYQPRLLPTRGKGPRDVYARSQQMQKIPVPSKRCVIQAVAPTARDSQQKWPFTGFSHTEGNGLNDDNPSRRRTISGGVNGADYTSQFAPNYPRLEDIHRRRNSGRRLTATETKALFGVTEMFDDISVAELDRATRGLRYVLEQEEESYIGMQARGLREEAQRLTDFVQQLGSNFTKETNTSFARVKTQLSHLRRLLFVETDVEVSNIGCGWAATDQFGFSPNTYPCCKGLWCCIPPPFPRNFYIEKKWFAWHDSYHYDLQCPYLRTHPDGWLFAARALCKAIRSLIGTEVYPWPYHWLMDHLWGWAVFPGDEWPDTHTGMIKCISLNIGIYVVMGFVVFIAILLTPIIKDVAVAFMIIIRSNAAPKSVSVPIKRWHKFRESQQAPTVPVQIE